MPVAPGGSFWSAPQLWKCLLIQGTAARPAACSLTAFWQSNITSSWAQDNRPLSRTLSYLSRLEALQFYHAHAPFFSPPSRSVGFSSPCFIYLRSLYRILNNLFCLCGVVEAGWVIWCCSLPAPALTGRGWNPLAGRSFWVWWSLSRILFKGLRAARIALVSWRPHNGGRGLGSERGHDSCGAPVMLTRFALWTRL